MGFTEYRKRPVAGNGLINKFLTKTAECCIYICSITEHAFLQSICTGSFNAQSLCIWQLEAALFSENYAKLYFDEKHLEKGLDRRGYNFWCFFFFFFKKKCPLWPKWDTALYLQIRLWDYFVSAIFYNFPDANGEKPILHQHFLAKAKKSELQDFEDIKT